MVAATVHGFGAIMAQKGHHLWIVVTTQLSESTSVKKRSNQVAQNVASSIKYEVFISDLVNSWIKTFLDMYQ